MYSNRKTLWIGAAALSAFIGYGWISGVQGPFRALLISAQDRPRPDDRAFVGRWRLLAESLPSAGARTGKKIADPYILLRPDSTFIAADMPIEDPFSAPEFRLQSGEGRWAISRNQDWMLVLVFPGGRGHSLHVAFEGKRFEGTNPIALYWPVGDPDSNERWVWTKAP